MSIELYQGDAMELAGQKITPCSVDLIYTDPPYPKKYHYCYEWLAKEAARVLKPSGFLIAYAGPYWKHKVMMTLGEHLDYYFDFVMLQVNSPILWPRRIITGYKSQLCYSQKGQSPLPRCNVLGKYQGPGPDKRFHHWGQDADTARYYIDCFCPKDGLVVDYFLGGGTFAEVCKGIGRNFIGFEKDAETFNTARARLEGAWGPGEKGRQQSMELIESAERLR